MSAPVPVHVQTMVIGTLFYGIAVGTSFYGIFSGISRLNAKNQFVMGTIIFCNIMLVLEVGGYLWQSLGRGNGACVYGNYTQNISYHLCMIAFNLFILYKACVITLKNKWVVLAAGICLLTRVVFGLGDMATSHGYIDAPTGECLWSFSSTILFGYMGADVVADLFGTVVTISSVWVFKETSFSKVLMAENVTRSAVSLLQAVVYVWASQTDTVFMFANGIQMCIISYLLNSEFWWADTRHAAFNETRNNALEEGKEKSFVELKEVNRNNGRAF
ncbi:hypothetical protein HDU81_002246 [Chytriomyces hyalinus]|nr:hypothetical protein HDU81_002246 [Chytriomyces hyalinus]